MSFNNRIFDINGPMEDRESFDAVIALAFRLSCHHKLKIDASSFLFDGQSGLVFSWSESDKALVKLPCPIGPKSVAEIAWNWLDTMEAKGMHLGHWECDAEHDGNNSPGWRVFLEDWGHVGAVRSAICCVRPCFVWHGK